MKKLMQYMALLFVICATQTMALATDLPTLSLTYPEDTPVGDTFTVDVTLADNLGFSAVQLTVGYDDSVLTCTSAQTGDLMAGMLSATNPEAATGAIIAGASTSEITGDGTVGTLTFAVIADGSYEFSLQDVVLASMDGITYSVDLDLGAQGTTEVLTQTTTDTADTAEATTTTPDDDDGTGETVYRTLFADTQGHWAAEAIDQAAELGLVNGYSDDYYGPDDTVTRAQLVTILWRNAGSPEPTTAASFIDLDPDTTYYHDAVAWAEETGVVNGYGNGYFGPNDNITREQLATILYRMGGENLGMAQLYVNIYNAVFEDADAISESLADAVYWAVYYDVWCGTDGLAVGTTLSPKVQATRGQIAVMLCAYLDHAKGET